MVGYYCESGPIADFNIYPCPKGHYCLNGTRLQNQYPCPTGYHRNVVKGRSEADCMTCPPKYACDSEGTDYPTKFCAAGYFCENGSDTTTPNIGPHANECPLGKYCPEGKMIF